MASRRLRTRLRPPPARNLGSRLRVQHSARIGFVHPPNGSASLLRGTGFRCFQAGGRSQVGGLRPMKTPPTWMKTYLRFSNLMFNQALKCQCKMKTMLKHLQFSGLHRLSVLHFSPNSLLLGFYLRKKRAGHTHWPRP